VEGAFRAPPDRSPAEPEPYNSGFFIKHKRELTTLPVLRYSLGHRKGSFKNPILYFLAALIPTYGTYTV
jgi:hypothetical protein